MTVIENSVLIHLDRTSVFDRLSDPRSELRWNPKVEQMELIGDEPIRVGSQLHAKWKLSKPLTLTITRWERPVAWAYSNGGPISVDLEARLEEGAEGTLLHVRFDARPHGAAVLFFPVFLLMIRREERQNMANLKSWLESSPG